MTRKLFLAISNVPLVLSNCSLLFISESFSWSSASLLPQTYVQRPSHLILKVFHNVWFYLVNLLWSTLTFFSLLWKFLGKKGSLYLFSNWSRRGCQISITCILRHLCFLLIITSPFPSSIWKKELFLFVSPGPGQYWTDTEGLKWNECYGFY